MDVRRVSRCRLILLMLTRLTSPWCEGLPTPDSGKKRKISKVEKQERSLAKLSSTLKSAGAALGNAHVDLQQHVDMVGIRGLSPLEREALDASRAFISALKKLDRGAA